MPHSSLESESDPPAVGHRHTKARCLLLESDDIEDKLTPLSNKLKAKAPVKKVQKIPAGTPLTTCTASAHQPSKKQAQTGGFFL